MERAPAVCPAPFRGATLEEDKKRAPERELRPLVLRALHAEKASPSAGSTSLDMVRIAPALAAGLWTVG